MGRRRPSINPQQQLLAAEVQTDGAGSFLVNLRQQGVREQAEGTTRGWSFTTDGTDGRMTLAVQPAPDAGLCVVQAKDDGGLTYLAQATYTGMEEVVVTVQTDFAGAPLDLTANQVEITVLAVVV